MTQTPPRLPLKLLKLTAPSADDLWEADTCQKWFEHQGKSNSSCTALNFSEEEQSRSQIQDVLRKVWTDLRPPRSLTDFGTTNLIHILIRRIWDAPWYTDNPKDPWSQYKPHESISMGYPAVIPSFSKWRNGTCDCLDVLHWEALSFSAKAGGLEGPVFLQLHLARLLLLTPVKKLFSHVQAKSRRYASNSLLPHDLYDVPDPDSECRQTLITWAKKDRHKARLAVIHAGAIFWHVRRYSSDSFAQSFAVFLAAITLWAYGTFSQMSFPTLHVMDEPSPATVEGHEQQPNATSAPNHNLPGVSPTSMSINSSSSPNASTEVILSLPTSVTNRRRMPNFIQLDRPVDDELVQHFIRDGEGITLYLEGVEDLCSDQGSKQVLKEAILILNEAKNIWSIAENYIVCLHGVVGS